MSYDLLSFTETRNIPGLLVRIDFEKAFDSTSGKFIHNLEYLGSGDNMIKWINSLNTKIKVSILQKVSFQNSLTCLEDVDREIAPYIVILRAERFGYASQSKYK